jgi:hypothetical protein
MKKIILKAMIPLGCPPLEIIFPKPIDQDKARAILQHLFYVRLGLRTDSGFAPQLDRSMGWCPVSSASLQKITRDYRKILVVLMQHGVVEEHLNKQGKATYHAGKFTKLYRTICRPEPGRFGSQRYRVEHIKNPLRIAAIERYYLNERYDRMKESLLGTTPWYSMNLDFIERLEVCANEDELKRISPEDFSDTIGVMHQFNDGICRYASRDAFAGRIHTHFSNLLGILRPFLRIREEDSFLIMIDVVNAQPYIIASLFRHPELIALIPEFQVLAPIIRRYSGLVDVKLFHHDCVSGKLYSRIVEASGMTRAEAKSGMFTHLLFCRPQNHLKGEEKEVRERFQRTFRSLYPNVFKLLWTLKQQKRSTLPFIASLSAGPKDKGRMFVVPNLIAQRLEVALLLNSVTYECSLSGIETATIHDAWVLRKNDQVAFMDRFNAAFRRLGIAPPTVSTIEMIAPDIKESAA